MLIAFHKPYNVLSQFTQEVADQRTLADFGLPRQVYPIGRLDRDSEGLLLLSDEKGLVAQLLEPSAKIAKRYFAQVEGIPNSAQLAHLRNGVDIFINKLRHTTLLAHAEMIDDPGFAERRPPIRVRKSIPDAWISLTITEGKNRQIRRMCAAVGLPVLRLVRMSVGPYILGNLAEGEWRQL